MTRSTNCRARRSLRRSEDRLHRSTACASKPPSVQSAGARSNPGGRRKKEKKEKFCLRVVCCSRFSKIAWAQAVGPSAGRAPEMEPPSTCGGSLRAPLRGHAPASRAGAAPRSSSTGQGPTPLHGGGIPCRPTGGRAGLSRSRVRAGMRVSWSTIGRALHARSGRSRACARAARQSSQMKRLASKLRACSRSARYAMKFTRSVTVRPDHVYEPSRLSDPSCAHDGQKRRSRWVHAKLLR